MTSTQTLWCLRKYVIFSVNMRPHYFVYKYKHLEYHLCFLLTDLYKTFVGALESANSFVKVQFLLTIIFVQ